jgi:hypothetical protein
MTITDEMMDKFEPVFLAKGLRAALEAVAPMLIAQGMRMAASICEDMAVGFYAMEAIRESAQELDPQ